MNRWLGSRQRVCYFSSEFVTKASSCALLPSSFCHGLTQKDALGGQGFSSVAKAPPWQVQGHEYNLLYQKKEDVPARCPSPDLDFPDPMTVRSTSLFFTSCSLQYSLIAIENRPRQESLWQFHHRRCLWLQVNTLWPSTPMDTEPGTWPGKRSPPSHSTACEVPPGTGPRRFCPAGIWTGS